MLNIPSLSIPRSKLEWTSEIPVIFNFFLKGIVKKCTYASYKPTKSVLPGPAPRRGAVFKAKLAGAP